jgi:hypothetical protein
VAFFLGPEQGLLIASSSPLEIDHQQIQALEHRAGVRQQLDAIGAHSLFSLLGEVVIYDDSYRKALARLARDFKVPEGLVSTDAYPYLEYQTPKGNIVPGEFLLDSWFFVRLRGPVLPPDLALRNLDDPEDRDFILGMAYEEREDYAAAVDHLGRIKGKSQGCAQLEIEWIRARQRKPKEPPPPWQPCR